jgi:lysophospholipase L1-like esterase
MSASADMRDIGMAKINGAGAGCGPPPGDEILWLDGRDPLNGALPANGAALSSVVNKGSLGGTFTASAGLEPTFTASCLGGLGCMTFDGTNDELTSSLAASSWTALHSADTTCMVLFRTDLFSPETTNGLLSTAGTATTQRGILTAFDDATTTENRMRIEAKNGGSVTSNRILVNSMFDAQLWQRFVWTFQPALTTNAIDGYVSNVLKASSGAQLAVPDTGAPTNTLRIGSTVGANYLDGDIAQVVCYASALDSTQRAALDAWASCIETSLPYGPMPLPQLAASSTICAANERPCRIGVIGDSITAVTSPSSWVNGYLRSTYPTSIAFTNVAVGGTTIEIAKTNQWQNNLRTSGVHSIMMLIGTNDIGLNSTPAVDILSDIDEVAAAAIALNMKVITVSIIPRCASYGGACATLQPIQDAVNAGLAARANGTSRLHADVYVDMEEPVDTNNLATAYDSGDGLHPNQTGQDALGAAVDVDIVFQ